MKDGLTVKALGCCLTASVEMLSILGTCFQEGGTALTGSWLSKFDNSHYLLLFPPGFYLAAGSLQGLDSQVQ